MAYLAAVEGAGRRCRRLADNALVGPATTSAPAAEPWARWALGLLHLCTGDLATALA